MGAEGYTYVLGFRPVPDCSSAWFNNKLDSLGGYAPGVLIGKSLMRERTLGPSRVGKTQAVLLVAHIQCGGFNHRPINTGFKSSLLSPLLYKFVDGAQFTPPTRLYAESLSYPVKIVAVERSEEAIGRILEDSYY